MIPPNRVAHILFIVFFILLVSTEAAPSILKRTPDHTEAKRATCTPASGGDASIDDVPAIKAAISSCGTGGTIVIPAGYTYMIRSVLDFTGCTSCDFQIKGTLKVSDDLSY